MRLDEDMHVHSTFSDGKGTVWDNVNAAELCGLRRLGCVDHVRHDTAWVSDFVREVRHCARTTSVQLVVGVEAKILDEAGHLDCPADLTGVDFVYAADHQFPMGNRCLKPGAVRDMLTSGEVTPETCIEALVLALCGAMSQVPAVVIAHMFSVLPKVGLSEDQVTDQQLDRLAVTASDHWAKVEFDERWNCPGVRALRAFQARGVEILCSSDAHMSKRVGMYRHAHSVAAALESGDASRSG